MKRADVCMEQEQAERTIGSNSIPTTHQLAPGLSDASSLKHSARLHHSVVEVDPGWVQPIQGQMMENA